MKHYFFHVAYLDNQGIERTKSTLFGAKDLLQAHQAGRKLVSLLLCDSEVSDILFYYLESLKS